MHIDHALPLDEVNASINSSSLVYGRTYGLVGRSAHAAVMFPYVWGEIDGLLVA